MIRLYFSSRFRVFVYVGLLSMLGIIPTGCLPEPGTHDPGYVAKEWSMTMREFGIVPVFPPREDVQVGDVYAMPIPPDSEVQLRAIKAKGEFLPIPLLLASIDLKTELEEHYKLRFSFPATPSSQPATQPYIFPQPTAPAGTSVFATGKVPDRLRLGGFPEFFSTQISQGGISGLVPTEAVNVAFGALGSANKRVRVSVPMVESYGVPAAAAFGKVSESNGVITFGNIKPRTTNQTIAADDVALLIQPAGGFSKETQALIDSVKTDANAKGYLVLITEIYATRSIDISIDAEVSNAGGLNLTPTAALLKKLPGFSDTQPSSQSASVQPAAAAAQFASTTPEQTAAAMTNQLNEQLAASTPGVNVKFISVTAFGVSMRRTYERPIVIGYRGIVYKLNDKGNLVIAGSANGVITVTKKALADNIKSEIDDIASAHATAAAGVKTTVKLSFLADPNDNITLAKATADPFPSDAKVDDVEQAIREAVQGKLGNPDLIVKLQRP